MAHDGHGDGLGMLPSRLAAADLRWSGHGPVDSAACRRAQRRYGISADLRGRMARRAARLRIRDWSKEPDKVVNANSRLSTEPFIFEPPPNKAAAQVKLVAFPATNFT